MHGRALQAVIYANLALSAGCSLLTPQPAAGPANEPARSDPEPAQIVSTPASQPAEEGAPELERIAQWAARAARRDDIASRVGRPPVVGDDLRPTPLERQTFDLLKPPAQTAAPAADATIINTPATPLPGGAPEAPPSPPAAPSVKPLAARPAPETAVTTTAAPPAAVNTPQSAQNPALSIQELARMTANPSDEGGETYQSQLDRRVLHVLAGDYEQARKPLSLVSDERQQMARQFIDALIAIRESHGGEPERQTREVLAHIDELRAALAPLADMRISRLEICRSVRGFGQFDRIEPAVFVAGRPNELVTYCELADFESRQLESGEYESRFSLTTTVLSESGETVLEQKDDEIVDRCATRRRDCFIPKLIRLPATLAPGKYVVKSTIVDRIREKVAEKRATIRVVARS